MSAASPARQLRITLLQERSAGTFARVYLAEATGDGGISRIVAVKVLKEQWNGSEELLTRTRDEARLLARLHHKNILRVEAMAEIDGQPAIVMEFVDGVDVKQLIDHLASEGQRIPPRPAFRAALCAASALHAAYAKVPYGRSEALQVVHRDLKPSNVMVSVEGEVKVLDFGTARFTDEARMAKTGVLRFGSMKYMSPERRLGDRGEHASDVYALGLLLLEMLRGEALPLLPLDQIEHDRALADILARLGAMGLPNAEWEQSLHQTLLRMCHHSAEARLDAEQVVGLLRAFAEQADGPSLEAWSADTVSRIARQVYGDGIEGALSGSQVFVRSMSNAGATVGSELVAHRVDSSGPPMRTGSPAESGPPGVITRNGPTTGRPVGIGRPPGGAFQGGAPMALGAPLADEPTMLQADLDRTEPEADVAPWPEPEPERDGAHRVEQPVAWAPPASPERAPDPAPAASGGGGKTALVAVLIGLAVGLFGVVGIGAAGAAWWYFQLQPNAPAAPAPDRAAAATADAVTVGLESDDPTLQWLKLKGPSGDTLAKASPSASASLAPGDYTLSAKVVGRPAVEGLFVVEAADTWRCRVHDAAKVRCEADTSGGSVTLAPAQP